MRTRTENLKDSCKRATLKQPEYTPEKFHAAPKDKGGLSLLSSFLKHWKPGTEGRTLKGMP